MSVTPSCVVPRGQKRSVQTSQKHENRAEAQAIFLLAVLFCLLSRCASTTSARCGSLRHAMADGATGAFKPSRSGEADNLDTPVRKKGPRPGVLKQRATNNLQAIAQQRLMGNAEEVTSKWRRAYDDTSKDGLHQRTPSRGRKRKWKTSGILLQTITGSELYAKRERGDGLTLRERLFLVLNEPASGRGAYWFSRLTQFLLVTSSLTVTYETVSFVNQATGPEIWKWSKLIFNAIFTVEALLRIASFQPLLKIYRDPLMWLDVLTVLPVYLRVLIYPDSMDATSYLNKEGAGITIRVIEALAAFRILKLCRYFEGANILAQAVGKSMGQLLVPLFMLLIMVFCFATIVYEIEFDGSVQACVQEWVKGGIEWSFIKSHPDGVTWDCSTCTQKLECQSDDTGCMTGFDFKCRTCNGHPVGHPECNGVIWGQTFPDIPRVRCPVQPRGLWVTISAVKCRLVPLTLDRHLCAQSMWFMFVTVSTVGYGDVSPSTWQGQIFVCMVIVCGIIFLAMPLAIVGSTFGQVRRHLTFIWLQSPECRYYRTCVCRAHFQVWDERQIFKLQRHLRQLLAENGVDPNDAVVAFRNIDTGGDGTISLVEFKEFVHEFKLDVQGNELKELWKALDSDGSGTITLEEFIGTMLHILECTRTHAIQVQESKPLSTTPLLVPQSVPTAMQPILQTLHMQCCTCKVLQTSNRQMPTIILRELIAR